MAGTIIILPKSNFECDLFIGQVSLGQVLVRLGYGRKVRLGYIRKVRWTWEDVCRSSVLVNRGVVELFRFDDKVLSMLSVEKHGYPAASFRY